MHSDALDGNRETADGAALRPQSAGAKSAGPKSSARDETTAFDQSAFSSRADAESAADNLRQNETLSRFDHLPQRLGRYRLDKLLGRGGMGSVYLAQDLQLDRPVALKIPRHLVDAGSNGMARFLREARAVAMLTHPNICSLYDVGEAEGVHFLAMAYIQGRPLSDYLKSAKLQPERGVALTIYKIAQALQEAHAKGILHRDLKPANVMIDSRAEPIVMDFGLAQRFNEQVETRLTQEGTVVGTPAYMAPEQIDGRAPVGPATDVYSLGVVLYELLTGQCPFSGSIVSVIGQVMHAEPAPLSARRPNVSAEMVRICQRAMAKNPAQRFASMKDFAGELAGFIKGAGTVTVSAPLAPAGPSGLEELLNESGSAFASAPASAPLAATRRQQQAVVRQRVLVGSIAAVVVVFVIGAIVFWPRSPEAPAPGPISRAEPARAPTPPAVSRQRPKQNGPAPAPSLSTASDYRPDAENEPLQSEDKTAPTDSSGRPPSDPPITTQPAGSSHDTPPTTPAASPKKDPPGVDKPAKPEPATPQRTPGPPSFGEPSNPPRTADNREPRPRPVPNFGFGDGPPEAPRPAGEFDNGSLEENFARADRNKDGKLDETEIPRHIITRGDKNRDHMLDLKEAQTAFARLKEKLFAPPTPGQMRRMPRRPGGPGGPGPGGPGGPPR